jgi:lipopolysaccharide transport system permease protein
MLAARADVEQEIAATGETRDQRAVPLSESGLAPLGGQLGAASAEGVARVEGPPRTGYPTQCGAEPVDSCFLHPSGNCGTETPISSAAVSPVRTHASTAAALPARAPTKTIICPTQGWASLQLDELWRYRELIGFLVWRDLKVRYRQTLFGVVWVVLQPLALMAVFSLFLGQFLKVNTGNVPYPVFAFSALVPWTLFAQSMTAASQSLVTNAGLLGKIYFPRLLLPVAAVGSFLMDFAISSTLLIIFILLYGLSLSWGVLLIPFLAVLVVLAALGVGIGLSAVNVRYRDVQSAIPLITQIWLFASPIAYPSSLVPAGWREVYAINPMVSVLDGFRWALLGKAGPSLGMIAVSTAVASGLFVASLAYFRRTERSFADII